MTPRQLKYFVTIAQCGSMTAAASQLHVTQPTLSHHLAELEAELQTPVLQRHARGVTLTPAGQRLYERATAILRQLDTLRDDVHAANQEPRGEVALCLGGSLAPLLAAPLYRSLMQTAPDVHLQLHTAISHDARSLVEARRVDLAVLPTAFEMPRLNIVPLVEERLHLVGSPEFLGQQPHPIPFRELAAFPLISPDRNHDLRRLVERTALDLRVKINVRIEINDAGLLRSLMLARLGCAVMPPDTFPYAQNPPFVSRPIVEPELVRTQSLVWLDDRPLTPAGRLVADTLRRLVSQLVAEGALAAKLLQP